MLNYLWGGMILIGVIFGAFNGKMPDITNAALDAAKEAVMLCITMTGVMSLWVGLMEIAEKAGVIRAAARKLAPVVTYLFPGVPKEHPANKYITTNIIANILGLGWAATPAGLQAMEELQKINEEECRRYGVSKRRGPQTATNGMCNFLILNISSLQLIPVNVIAYRSQYGSVNPASIIGAGIVATAVSTAVAVVFCKGMDRGNRKR